MNRLLLAIRPFQQNGGLLQPHIARDFVAEPFIEIEDQHAEQS